MHYLKIYYNRNILKTELVNDTNAGQYEERTH